MADQRFFRYQGPLTLARLAEVSGAELTPPARGDLEIADVAPLDTAGPDTISFLDNKRYVASFETTRAGAIIVAPELADRAPPGAALLVTDKPYRAFAMVAHAFYQDLSAPTGIHPTATIEATATLGTAVSIAAGVVVGADARIGDHVVLGANSVVGRGVTIGEAAHIGSHVTLEYCDIGARTMIHAGARIGQRGFGFDMDAAGFIDVPQLGRVIIGSDVEIGANSTVDRGSGRDTRIGDGCKIDNLVQVAHNVQLGDHCVLVAQSGIAGSTRLGARVVLAAQAGLTGHLTVGDGAQIAAQSGVMRNVPAGAKLMGSPAMPIRQFFRMYAKMQKLGRSGDN